MPFVQLEHLSHTYGVKGANPLHALRDINLEIEPGALVAVSDANGCGKSTLGLPLNGNLLPALASVTVDRLATRDPTALRVIRSKVGLVLQSPADQIVATIVEEDVAFGPENLGLAESLLPAVIRSALERVGMWEQRHRPPHMLSAGQQQRVAIAGALAMNPQCLVLDEGTAMLDPAGAVAILDILLDLNASGMTVIFITHDMEEAARARRIIALHQGRKVLDGSPEYVFGSETLPELGLQPPLAARLGSRLADKIPGISRLPLSVEKLAADLLEAMP